MKIQAWIKAVRIEAGAIRVELEVNNLEGFAAALPAGEYVLIETDRPINRNNEED